MSLTETHAQPHRLPVLGKSPVVKRSIVIAGHKTAVSLEDDFWMAFKAIAARRRTTLSELAALIDGDRERGNLSSSIRLFVLKHFREGDGAVSDEWLSNLQVHVDEGGAIGETAARALLAEVRRMRGGALS